ncbi:MAG: EpsI family protein, partial [Nitrospirota bacterium]|nr:EpsI family protein [Nitrospirota bacterium]
MSPRTRNLFLSCLIMGAAFLLMRHREDTPVPLTRSFTSFPLSVGGWDGTPLTLDQKEKDILKADDYALVNYAPADGGPPLLFYTAYYRHQTAARNIHSPKNCLPGSGWDVLSSRTIDAPIEGPMATPVRINETVIQKGLDE